MTATHTATRTVAQGSLSGSVATVSSAASALGPASPPVAAAVSASGPAAALGSAAAPPDALAPHSDADDAACAHSPAAPPSMIRERAETVADVFKVLADPSRVLILEALKEAGELCVLHLADSVGMSQSAVSHNLRLLRQAGLVARRRDGRLVYYRPDDDHVTGLVALCADHVAHREVFSGAFATAGAGGAARQERGTHAA